MKPGLQIAVVSLLALCCAGLLGYAQSQKISFPGKKAEAKSPDGHFNIRNVDDEKQEPAHTLILTDTKTGRSTKFYSYGRHVDVLWSPASDGLVVNDYEGSDSSHPVLFMTPLTGHGLDLREKLTDFLRTLHQTKSLLGNDHVYVLAKSWLNGDEIICEVNGYGAVDPKGFSARYVYKVGVGFKSLP